MYWAASMMAEFQQRPVYLYGITPFRRDIIGHGDMLSQKGDVILYGTTVYHLCDMMTDPGNILRTRDRQYRQFTVIGLR